MRRSPPALLALALGACSGQVGEPPALGPIGPTQPPRPSPSSPPATPPGATCANTPRDPGRVTIHRLNRAEYDNTVKDLLGTSAHPAADFPNDDHGYGFDNIADVLSMAPLLAEKYANAADALVDEIFLTPFAGPTTVKAEAEALTGSVGSPYGTEGWNLYTNGQIEQRLTTSIAGTYTLSTRLFGQQAGADPVHVELSLDGVLLRAFDVSETSAAPRTLSVDAMLSQGAHTFSVAFTNDYYDANTMADRNLIVDWLSAAGPNDYTAPPTNPAARARVMICDPAAAGQEACARRILSAFARRAWRRPVTAAEDTRLYALIQIPLGEHETFDTAIGVGLKAILLSPHFLFRVELDPDPTSLSPHALSAHELASRISYFLWSSMPDDVLAAKADDGTLLDPATRSAEVQRMLGDPRSKALVDNFAGQWLYTRKLADVLPDPAVYPSFDASLRGAMGQETAALFSAFLTEDRPALDLLDADFSFLNDRLATHYGLAAPGSAALVRTTLTDGKRGGLLTQGSVLTVTSRPKRTAPVIRGKWILEQLLCQAPPPPPANVPGFPEDITGATVRQRLEQHRANPNCASCHATMDPLGLALESYDGVGAWRSMDAGQAIDASGTLPDGRSFNGAQALAAIIKADPMTPRCFAERSFIYALGRGVESQDRCTLSDITAGYQAQGGSFKALMTAIVNSPAFTSRRGEQP